MKTFGKVVVNSNACGVSIQNKGNIQAPKIVPSQSNKLDEVSVNLKHTIQTNISNVRGCTFLPDSKMIFASYINNQVSVLKPDGSADFDLNTIGPVWDVVYIGDNYVAVTSGDITNSKKINIINVENRNVQKVLNVTSANDGVAFKDGKLIYCAREQGLKMISLSDKSIISITTNKMSSQANVDSKGDKLFYSNEENHTVNCCDFHGKTLWTFSEPSALNFPCSLSVDNDGNVFVAGALSHNVIVISIDGQRYRQLLSKKDGLDCPKLWEYDRTNNKL
ncbi:unnamed protein product [Mytilus coruscus]|uniref:Uncharacterized protein n=1 Tax=Mytilus coruscus TaxID=42192 RepID=A0A6J8EZC1_MYTCO|nr:unnamed protein product [Mytilus coruscus]